MKRTYCVMEFVFLLVVILGISIKDGKAFTVDKRCYACISNITDYASKADIEKMMREVSLIKEQLKPKPQDCRDIQNDGHRSTGIYTIYPRQRPRGIQVRCDMDTTSGGWTVIQRRVSKSNFYRDWNDYESGFGSLNGNFWLGNLYIHMLTSTDRYELRIDLTTGGSNVPRIQYGSMSCIWLMDPYCILGTLLPPVDLTSIDRETAYAHYREFSVSNAESGYRLYVREYRGNAGDSLISNGNGMRFSTYDRDNDISSSNCAVLYHGAWWYDSCHTSNLNGDYGNTDYAKGPVWWPWKRYYSPMKTTEMKIRRVG
ncbi:microfibril-associated glycoprotein 4-like [Mercenaria mercenaria]|uniref:microfibril-associated glycoprotein 4-like n=1 Tax=Mercenaria mercenaria TaxID=6596 RepID=UPI00234EFE73|nr:microfibril-associated glycoprotein 4-like [Mercenaria mercenaria]